MTLKKISREELYNLVWSKPLCILAEEYSISDTGLKKICKKHNIPLPRQGHWQKVKYGKAVTQIELPEIQNDQVQINLSINEGERTTEGSYLSKYLRLKKEIENNKSLKLKVPDKLTKSHPLIIKTRSDLKTKKPGIWNNTNGLLISSQNVLNLQVSKSNILRALKFMNSLIVLLQQREHDIIVENCKTYALVYNEKLEIRCREILKRVLIEENPSWNRYDNIPSGRLKLIYEDIYPRKEWKDGKELVLEDQLAKIITFFELKSKEIKAQRKEHDEWKRLYEIKQKKEEEFKKLQEQELHNFQLLLTNSDLLFKAENMRNYISRVKDMSLKKGNHSIEINNWIDWANQKANWLDPLHDFKNDKFLGEFNNSYLKKEKQRKPWER